MSKELVDLRKKNLEQLNAELISARESQFGLRIKHKTGQLNETSELFFDARASYGFNTIQINDQYGESSIGGVIFSLGYAHKIQ